MRRRILLSPVYGQDIVVDEVFGHYRHSLVVAANLSAPYLAAETPVVNTRTLNYCQVHQYRLGCER